MTDNLNPTQDSSTETENTERMIPKGRFNEVNEENKTLKARLKAIEDKQAADDATRQAQQQKEMAEQNRYKELYEASQSELASLKATQDEGKRYRESFESTLQTRLAAIPDDKKHLIPNALDPINLSKWLDVAMPDLTVQAPQKPNAPRLDGGSGSAANRNSLKLTDTEIQFATEAGISLEAYAKQKEARGKPLDLNKQE